jgi:hypothetical protein
MRRAIVDIAAQRMAAAMADSNDADAASIFSETLTQLVADPSLQRFVQSRRRAMLWRKR